MSPKDRLSTANAGCISPYLGSSKPVFTPVDWNIRNFNCSEALRLRSAASARNPKKVKLSIGVSVSPASSGSVCCTSIGADGTGTLSGIACKSCSYCKLTLSKPL